MKLDFQHPNRISGLHQRILKYVENPEKHYVNKYPEPDMQITDPTRGFT